MKTTIIRCLSFIMAMAMAMSACLVVVSAKDPCTHPNAKKYGDPVEATCSEWGYQIYECPDCEGDDKFFASDFVKPHMLNPEKEVIDKKTVKPTCTTKGYDEGICPVCGRTHRFNEKDMVPHTWGDWEVVTKPTCDGTVGVEKRTCKVCGKTEERTMDAKGHDFKPMLDTLVAPTCDKTGKITYKCANCDASYEVVIAARENHVWETREELKPTCTTAGHAAGEYCKICGEPKPGTGATILPALGHTKDDMKVLKDPTCTEKGLVQYTCKNCGETYTEETDAKGHSWGSSPTAEEAPTCTKYGYKLWGCTECGATKTESFEPTGHKYGDKIEVPATCTEAKYYKYVCSVCGDVKIEKIEGEKPLGHKWTVTTPAKDATCTEAGNTEGKKCDTCGEEILSKVIPATNPGHADEKKLTVKTCTVANKDYFFCPVCGIFVKEAAHTPVEGEKESHYYKEIDRVPATCTTPGSITWKCEGCGDFYVEEIPATGHKMGKATITKATCSAEGLSVTKCTNPGCKYEEKVVLPIDPEAHDFEVEVLVAATCTKGGLEKHTCKLCGLVKHVETKALGHKLDKTAAVKETCTTAGTKEYYKCSACGLYFEDKDATKPIADIAKWKAEGGAGYVAALGHDWEVIEAGTKPTCTEDGKFPTKRCTICKEKIEDKTFNGGDVSATGHKLSYIEGLSLKATCKDGGQVGYDYYGCQNPDCLYAEIRNFKDAPEHVIVKIEAVAPTCEKTGLTEGKKCSVCGEIVEAQEVVPAIPHKNAAGEVISTSCTRPEGTDTHCVLCDKDIAVVHPADQCSEKHYPATCISLGYTIKFCKACGTQEVVPDDNGKLADHTWVKDDKASIDATYDKNGLLVEKCSVCGETREKVINKGILCSLDIKNALNADAKIVNGGKVAINVNLKAVDVPLAVVDMKVNFNKDVLTFTGFDADSVFGKKDSEIDAFAKDGVVTISALASNDAAGKIQNININGEVTLITLYFDVKYDADAKDIDAAFDVAYTKLYDLKVDGTKVETNEITKKELKDAKTVKVEKLGSINGDAVINTNDALSIKGIISGELSNSYDAAADLDFDGEITINDFKILQRIIVGRLDYDKVAGK